MVGEKRHPDPSDAVIVERMAPFAAWLATRIGDEPSRRRYCRIVEAYLRFVARDAGPAGTRGVRFVVAYRTTEPPETTRAALARLAEYDEVVRRTLPVEG